MFIHNLLKLKRNKTQFLLVGTQFTRSKSSYYALITPMVIPPLPSGLGFILDSSLHTSISAISTTSIHHPTLTTLDYWLMFLSHPPLITVMLFYMVYHKSLHKLQLVQNLAVSINSFHNSSTLSSNNFSDYRTSQNRLPHPFCHIQNLSHSVLIAFVF